MRITLLVLLLSTLAACAKPSEGKPKDAQKKAEAGAPGYAPANAGDMSKADRLKAHPWCVRYISISPQSWLDILVEERNEFLSNGMKRMEKFEMHKEIRLRTIADQVSKWTLEGDSLYVTKPDGSISIGELKFLENDEMNIVWVRGDRGITYKKCE